MNPSTPFSSSNDDPTDFPELDDTETTAKREGLPTGFRMRASSHYVDQLETPPRPTLRAIPIAAIESDSVSEASQHLVDSIREHGVLEPLIVQVDPRGRQYRLIAGRRRLSGARAAGLREVPCVVHTVSDVEAIKLREATRDGSRRETVVATPPPDTGTWIYPAQREVESALTTIEACTPLLNLASETARRGAAQVIAAECRRAQRTVHAMKALGDGVALRRVSVRPGDLFARLRDVFRDEQRLVGAEPVIQITGDPQLALYGDDDLLVTGMASGLSALTAAAGNRPRDILLHAVYTGHGSIALEVTDRSLVLAENFIRTAFTSTWPVPNGDAVLMLLQAARRIATAHGGSLALVSDRTRTTLRFEVPAEPVTRSTAN